VARLADSRTQWQIHWRAPTVGERAVAWCEVALRCALSPHRRRDSVTADWMEHAHAALTDARCRMCPTRRSSVETYGCQ